MINLNLKFSKGSTDPVGECGNFAAGIDASGVGQIDGRGLVQTWYSRIEVYGKTAAHADELRDQVLAALNGQPSWKYYNVLRPFMALMAGELAANSHKGDRPGWLKMTKWQALGEVKHHHQKLDVAVAEGRRDLIVEHAADVANCAMMLLDVCGLLADPDVPDAPDAQAPGVEALAELALAKRYLRQALAALNPRAELATNIRNLLEEKK